MPYLDSTLELRSGFDHLIVHKIFLKRIYKNFKFDTNDMFFFVFFNYFFKSVDVKKGKSRIWIIIDFCGYTVDPAVFLCGPGSSLNL